MDAGQKQKIINRVGPMPEPCTMERVIIRVADLLSPILVNCSLSVRNETTHWIILSGSFSNLSLLTSSK